MKKKKLIIGTLLLVVVLTAVIIFTFNSPGPGDLPENSAIKEEIESSLDGVRIEEIVDRQQVGDDHAFFPFLTDDGHRGMSVWKVENGKWTIGASDNGGEPSLWKIDPEDPDTFYIIYHLHPDDDVDKIDFYMKRERNYHVTGEHQSYVPQIMAKEEVEVSRDYGVQPVPEIWRKLYNQLGALTPTFSISNPNQQIQTSYVSYDDEGEHTRLEQTLGNQSFSNGEQTDFIIWMDPLELEEEQVH
ncbi:hypothetical protein [Halobacillus sp. B23F22_1]|uniref:hypothetical protein n=1 Tax=Halobacillus sp. B23F22_1 TaxID=3459514 RepID=UPI00373EBE83